MKLNPKFTLISAATAAMLIMFNPAVNSTAYGQEYGSERVSTSNQFMPDDFDAKSNLLVGDENLRGELNPAGALLRSFVLPGWGHYYADSSSWRRGQYHLGADLVLVGTWIYLHGNANMLQNNMYSHASAYAGINLRNVPINVEIAVGSSNSLDTFNETQLRTRNWDRLIDDTPENRWNWVTEDRRGEYLRMRDRRDRAEQQIPAIISMMVVNRVISGVHAFITTRNQNSMLNDTSIGLTLPESTGGNGFIASFQYRF
ncbi:MAG: hypothetical protein LAT84_13230 [Balneolia bacterium]|nr:hypothetical protein [Balneolia bacterium]